MAAQAFAQNGARVFLASRKESELRKICANFFWGGIGGFARIELSLKC